MLQFESGADSVHRVLPGLRPGVVAMLAMALFATLPMSSRAQDLPETPAEALAHEKADRMPATSFYDTPAPLPPGSAGQRIRSVVVTGYALPSGVRAIRILYHSRSAGGNDVPASGLVLLPPGSPPEGGWPVIAWAHGTTGVARVCAPSMMKDLGHGTDWLLPIVRAGFAVVAADYAGLGTDVPHEYTSLDAQASDVINGVKAAQEAVPQLSQRWVVDGHSQGGGAAWFVAQQEAVLHDPNYLGAVSVAGDMNMPWLMRLRGKQLVAVLRAYGIKARFPQFHVGDMLTKPALAQYRTITTKRLLVLRLRDAARSLARKISSQAAF